VQAHPHTQELVSGGAADYRLVRQIYRLSNSTAQATAETHWNPGKFKCTLYRYISLASLKMLKSFFDL
jgi:hypothetical protein